MSAKESYKAGLLAGFKTARDNPDLTFEQFSEDMDKLQAQLESMPDWKLRLIAGRGNRMDHVRMAVENWIEKGYPGSHTDEKKPAPEDAGQ